MIDDPIKLQALVQQFAKEHEEYKEDLVAELLSRRPTGISLNRTVAQMLNIAHATGYFRAKSEVKN